MADVQRLIKMLKSSRADERFDACEQLRVMSSLPPQALEALRPLIDDTNLDVADAAWRAIELHAPGSYPKKIHQPIRTRKDVETCKNCGTPLHPSLNHCTNCKRPFRVSRLANNQVYPKVDMTVVKCFAAKQDETLVLSSPDPESERLYLLGPGEMLPIESEKEDYYCLHLPRNELGFVSKDSGIIVELGIGEVKEPLGFVRQNYKKVKAEITVRQPNGKKEIIGSLQENERYPIVEEREDWFKIQMPNGLQGWVHKAYVLRTISPESVLVSQKPSSEFADIALGVAGLIAIGIIGGLLGDPEEDRIRRGVDRALRDRGM